MKNQVRVPGCEHECKDVTRYLHGREKQLSVNRTRQVGDGLGRMANGAGGEVCQGHSQHHDDYVNAVPGRVNAEPLLDPDQCNV